MNCYGYFAWKFKIAKWLKKEASTANDSGRENWYGLPMDRIIMWVQEKLDQHPDGHEIEISDMSQVVDASHKIQSKTHAAIDRVIGVHNVQHVGLIPPRVKLITMHAFFSIAVFNSS